MSMIRVYFKLILPVALIFLTVSLIARALGTTQPPNPALRGFIEGCEGKPQPCWYGIVPGVTTVAEADSILTKQRYKLVEDHYSIRFYKRIDAACYVDVFYEGKATWKVDIADIPSCHTVQLGDLEIELGAPYAVIESGVTFSNNLILAGMQYTFDEHCMILKPYGNIARISLVSQSIVTTQYLKPPQIPAWVGAMSFAHYNKGFNMSCHAIKPFAA